MAAPMKKHGSKRKEKTFLEFDENARADYLKGFHKRKVERKQLARDKKDKLIREERKALRQQIRDLKTKRSSSKSLAMIPEIEQLVKPEVFDLPEHTVTIADIGQVDFVGKTGMRMGQNNGQESSKEDVSDTEAVKDEEEQTSDMEKSKKETGTNDKSLKRKLANCSNQLSSQVEKSRKVNRKQHFKARLQAKKFKKKKNKLNKPNKR